MKRVFCLLYLDCPAPPRGQGHGPPKGTQETYLGTVFLLTTPPPPRPLAKGTVSWSVGPRMLIVCPPAEVQTHAER